HLRLPRRERAVRRPRLPAGAVRVPAHHRAREPERAPRRRPRPMMRERPARPRDVLAWPAGDPSRANPYTGLLYEHLRPLGWRVRAMTRRRLVWARPAIVHVHWPEWAVARGSGPTAA